MLFVYLKKLVCIITTEKEREREGVEDRYTIVYDGK
jgi:hypothetical protein